MSRHLCRMRMLLNCVGYRGQSGKFLCFCCPSYGGIMFLTCLTVCACMHSYMCSSGRSRIFARGVRDLVPLGCPKPLHALSPSDPFLPSSRLLPSLPLFNPPSLRYIFVRMGVWPHSLRVTTHGKFFEIVHASDAYSISMTIS